MEFLSKVVVSAIVIAGVSELGKRSTPIASILASLPLTSVLAITWLYFDTKDPYKVRDLSIGIFWAVLPSLLFFLVLYILLKLDVRFVWSMLVSCVTMVAGYGIYIVLLRRFGIAI